VAVTDFRQLPAHTVTMIGHAACEDTRRPTFTRKESPMLTTAYVAAISAMLFAAGSALTLIYFVDHLDPQQRPSSPEHAHVNVAA
jgi:hypothetical protein